MKIQVIPYEPEAKDGLCKIVIGDNLFIDAEIHCIKVQFDDYAAQSPAFHGSADHDSIKALLEKWIARIG